MGIILDRLKLKFGKIIKAILNLRLYSMKIFIQHSKLFILVHSVILMISCAGSGASNTISNDLKLITQYSADYFVGIGQGSSPSEQVALKIARANALGELSSSVKVFISSKVEVEASESSTGKSSESVSESIIAIGNATVRNPDYEILSSTKNASNGNFDIKVLAKKLKNDHFKEAAMSINLNDEEKLLNFLLKDEN